MGDGVFWVVLVRDQALSLSFSISRSACCIDFSLFTVKASKVVPFLYNFNSMIYSITQKSRKTIPWPRGRHSVLSFLIRV